MVVSIRASKKPVRHDAWLAEKCMERLPQTALGARRVATSASSKTGRSCFLIPRTSGKKGKGSVWACPVFSDSEEGIISGLFGFKGKCEMGSVLTIDTSC